MIFRDPASPLSSADIADIENELGVDLPEALRDMYNASNGGYPTVPVFENPELETVVAEFLPLTATGRVNAFRTYRLLVEQREIVARHFFPFAIDGGGDYFFADTRSPAGAVHFFSADAEPGDQLLDLNLNVVEFWNSLTDDGE